MRIRSYLYVEEKVDLILRDTLLFEVAADVDCLMSEAIFRMVLDCIHANHVKPSFLLAELFQFI